MVFPISLLDPHRPLHGPYEADFRGICQKKALQGPSKVNIGPKMCSRAQYWRVCQQKDTNIPFSLYRKSIYRVFLKPKKN